MAAPARPREPARDLALLRALRREQFDRSVDFRHNDRGAF